MWTHTLSHVWDTLKVQRVEDLRFYAVRKGLYYSYHCRIFVCFTQIMYMCMTASPFMGAEVQKRHTAIYCTREWTFPLLLRFVFRQTSYALCNNLEKCLAPLPFKRQSTFSMVHIVILTHLGFQFLNSALFWSPPIYFESILYCFFSSLEIVSCDGLKYVRTRSVFKWQGAESC